jgi:AraC-like DNA-binding protein
MVGIDSEREVSVESVRARARDAVLQLMGDSEELVTSVSGLTLIQRRAPVPPTSYVYDPSLAMILRGRKNIVLGDARYHYDESHFLLTAVGLPTITEVAEASPERPYVSVLLKIDLEMAKDVITRTDMVRSTEGSGSAMAVGQADQGMFEALERLVALVRTPEHEPMLGDLIKRELLYRVLTSPTGARLRQVVQFGTDGNRIARAIEWLRANFDKPLRVQDLAVLCGMAQSTFHKRFRSLAQMSPLQYQKHLRLHEARRLLLSGGYDAGEVGFRVGYESAPQFSREYKRMFGAPPVRETRRLLTGGIFDVPSVQIPEEQDIKAAEAF